MRTQCGALKKQVHWHTAQASYSTPAPPQMHSQPLPVTTTPTRLPSMNMMMKLAFLTFCAVLPGAFAGAGDCTTGDWTAIGDEDDTTSASAACTLCLAPTPSRPSADQDKALDLGREPTDCGPRSVCHAPPPPQARHAWKKRLLQPRPPTIASTPRRPGQPLSSFACRSLQPGSAPSQTLKQ